MTFLFNELLWWYTSGDCVMHSTVRFELWWRATCISPPYKQIWTRWNVTQQFTQLYEQCRAVSSEVGLHMIVAAVSVSPPLITNRPKTLITAKMLIPYYQFTHGVSYSTSLMACPTALPQFSELTTDNTLPTSLRNSESYEVWPLHNISMAGMFACNLCFLNSLFRQHIFSPSNVYKTKA